MTSVLNPISVLVVDDQPGSLVALEAALTSVKCKLVTATSGHDALQCVLAQDFAVICLDIEMPIMDGFETARLIRERERSRSTPIIFLTAHDPDGLRIPEGYRLGAVDYMFLPVDPFVLRSKVAAFVDLFREALNKEGQTAEMNQRATDELRDVNGRVVVAGIKAQEHAEVQIVLRGEAEKALSARDEFISLAAGELRRPLTAIKSDAQLAMRALAEAGSDTERSVLGYLQGIIGNADRLLLLTHNLTDRPVTRNGELPHPAR